MFSSNSVTVISCDSGVVRGNSLCKVIVQGWHGVDQDRVREMFSFLEGLSNPFYPFGKYLVSKGQHSSGSWRKSVRVEILVGCKSQDTALLLRVKIAC